VKAIAGLALSLGVAIGGDGGIRQRPVYVDAGECLARGADGKLFVSRSGEPCVALEPLALPEEPHATRALEASHEPSPQRRLVLEPGGFCGTPDWVTVNAPARQ
jgi:hypothetical protein